MIEKSEHGNPPVQTVAAGISHSWSPSPSGQIALMSPRFGTPGQCVSSTAQENGLTSAWETVRKPANSSPLSNAPIPVKNDACVRGSASIS